MKRNAPHSDAWNVQAPKREPWQEPDQFSGETPERAGGGSARLVPLAICAILLVVLLVEGVFIWGKSAQMQRNNAVYVPSAEQNVYPADESFSFICAILLVVLLVEGVFIWGKSAQMQRNNAVYVPSAEQNVYPADESFSFGSLQRAMKVSGQGEDMGRITGVAQDEKIVRVALSMGAVNDTVWDCSGAFYLQCGGTYYPNLGGYRLEQEHPEWAMRALNGYELTATSCARAAWRKAGYIFWCRNP